MNLGPPPGRKSLSFPGIVGAVRPGFFQIHHFLEDSNPFCLFHSVVGIETLIPDYRTFTISRADKQWEMIYVLSGHLDVVLVPEESSGHHQIHCSVHRYWGGGLPPFAIILLSNFQISGSFEFFKFSSFFKISSFPIFRVFQILDSRLQGLL